MNVCPWSLAADQWRRDIARVWNQDPTTDSGFNISGRKVFLRYRNASFRVQMLACYPNDGKCLKRWAGMRFFDESLKLCARGHKERYSDEAVSDVLLALLRRPPSFRFGKLQT